MTRRLLPGYEVRPGSGAAQVGLNVSAEAEPLYASPGFVRKPDPSMRPHL